MMVKTALTDIQHRESMRELLKNMPPDILEQVIELDINNMMPYLLSIGLSITPDQIRSDILGDPTQTVIYTTHNGKLTAVIRYKDKGDHLFIKALHLAQMNSARLLKSIMLEAVNGLKSETTDCIESVVQRSNHRSISLHEKLGFSKIKEMQKAIRFQIDRNELLRRMERTLRL